MATEIISMLNESVISSAMHGWRTLTQDTTDRGKRRGASPNKLGDPSQVIAIDSRLTRTFREGKDKWDLATHDFTDDRKGCYPRTSGLDGVWA